MMMRKRLRSTRRKIYRLDNAANLYPAIRNQKRPGVFRVSATLNEPVNPKILQTALNTTLKRIPGFSVKLRSGLFWHYFVHSDQIMTIQEDVINPCQQMTTASAGGFLIRIRYHYKTIALEAFHAITDGTGAMVFLKTLVAQYLTLLGVTIPATHGILDCNTSPQEDENSDFFSSFGGQSPTRKVINPRAFHVKGTPLDPSTMRIITGTVPINVLKQTTGLYHVTITEYLVAVFMKVLVDHQLSQAIRLKLPIKVQVPVNLRQFSPGDTLRNFSAYVTPSIDPAQGEYTFPEIVELVHHFLRYEGTKKHLQSQVAANVRYARNPLIRMLPLAIKNNIIFLGYALMGPVLFTSTLSNLGLIEVPEEMKAHVDSFGITLGATRGTNISCAVLGYRDDVKITFSRVISETEVERGFFRFLVEHGIPVHVETRPEE
jgi:NRPS condensation-like uncharacterized protein